MVHRHPYDFTIHNHGRAAPFLYTETAKHRALNREAVICPLSEAVRITHTTADTAAQQLGISRSLVYRLVARFLRRLQTSTLLSQRRGHKPHAKLLDPQVEKLLAETIQQVYLQRERPRVSDLMREVSANCYAKGYSPPNYRTIRNRLEQIGLRERIRARDGYSAARSRFARVRVNSIQTNRPPCQRGYRRRRVCVRNKDSAGGSLPCGCSCERSQFGLPHCCSDVTVPEDRGRANFLDDETTANNF